jgi:hypothetical protein
MWRGSAWLGGYDYWLTGGSLGGNAAFGKDGKTNVGRAPREDQGPKSRAGL